MSFFKETKDILTQQPLENNLSGPTQQMTAVRVRDVILSSDHPEWEKYGGPSSIGVIKYDILNRGNTSTNLRALPAAYPLYSHLRHIPLKNEIVFLLSAPAETLDESTLVEKKYYTDVVSLWNHPHHNGWVNKEDQTVGLSFEEQEINPLQPYEGDFILEGRYGQSLRFSTNYKTTPWQGVVGSPITILRNGQQDSSNGFDPINENIDKDRSSLYLTSDQLLPFTPANNNFASYNTKPIQGDKFKGSQVLLNSDRVYLNAREDSVILDANKSVGLSGKEVHVNANDVTVVESSKIQLGKDADQGILLGKDTIKLLGDLLDELNKVGKALTTAVSTPPGTPIVTLLESGQSLLLKANTLKSRLNSLPSKKSFVK